MKLALGARPEDILVEHEETAESANRAEAPNIEPSGAETIVELTIGKNGHGTNLTLKARTTSDFKIDIGQTLRMTFAPNRLHFFNHDTGLASY